MSDPVILQPIALEQRLLAEASRHLEAVSDTALDDSTANTQARAAGGDFEQRVIRRALALPTQQALHNALQQLRSLSALCLALGMMLAALAGAATARLVLQTDSAEPLNFYWALGSLLALPLLTLLLWLLLILLRPKSLGNSSLGSLLLGLGRRLLQRWHPDKTHIAAAQASAVMVTPAAGGQWALSALSHAVWLAYLCGCLVLCIFLLSVRQYDFSWQTTILSAETYSQLTTALGKLPALLGFSTPDASQIAASQWPSQPPADSQATIDSAWSGLLLGSLVIYGILPRAILLLLCGWLRRRALQHFRLDIEQPDYARLRPHLMPQMERIGVVDADDNSTPPAHTVVVDEAPAPPDGPVALLGLEIDRPACGWPPPVHDDWLDLGFVDDRNSRRRALQRLHHAEPPPRLLWVISSLALTPDRGLQNFLSELRQQTPAPLTLTLSEGHRLRERAQAQNSSNDLSQRLDDWQVLAANAGITAEAVLALDLEHLTTASRARLCQALGLDRVDDSPQAGALAKAFELIVEQAQGWRSYPDETEQLRLHQAISQLFDTTSAQRNLRFPDLSTLQNDPPGELKRSAEQFKNLLPTRLRTQPRWLAAGALGGALGCAALAALTNPAALAALPVWSLLGGVLAAVGVDSSTTPPAASNQTLDLSEPVSAAALFALVLSLQGRDEATITRLLDQTLDSSPPVLADARAVRAWLTQLDKRLQQALAQDAA